MTSSSASQGGEPAFKGYRGFPASICTSPNSMVVHGIPGDYELAAGDVLSIDVGVEYEGWVADAALTVALRPGEPDRLAAAKATRESLEAAVEQCRPGNRLGDVSHAVQERVERDGLSVIRSLVGHGIGRQMHEDPQVPELRRARPRHGARGGDGLLRGADGLRGRPRRADGGRQLGDLLPGRVAHGALRAHDRRDGRGPRILTPWHLKEDRAAA